MIKVTTPATREEFKAYYTLRYHVLREPGGHPRGTEKDDYEPISQHFMAIDETGHVVGVGRLHEKAPEVGQVAFLAVDPGYQQKGVGKTLLEAIEAAARGKGYHTLGAMSRVTATAYFEKFGFHVAGLPSLHIGIVQDVWMEKSLVI